MKKWDIRCAFIL